MITNQYNQYSQKSQDSQSVFFVVFFSFFFFFMKKKANNPQRSVRGLKPLKTRDYRRDTLGVIWRGWVVGAWRSQLSTARLNREINQAGDVRNTAGNRTRGLEMAFLAHQVICIKAK
jgi:hypothetical protein